MSDRVRQWALRRFGPDDEATRTFRAFWILDHWTWLERFNTWHVERYGEDGRKRRQSWPVRILSRAIVRVDDWQMVAAQVFGRAPWEEQER